MISRLLEKQIITSFHQGKAILILGARQVGKTTLVEKITDQSKLSTLFLNGDEPDVREMLTNATSTQLKAIIGHHELVVIDEAQRILNIGITIKLIVDNIPNIQIIVTGSSSLELANKIKEPLTGRKYEYHLYPISILELINHTSLIEEKRMLEHRLIYGYYPDIINREGEEKKNLNLLADSYLYKDILTWENIKKPTLLNKLLQALALQLGNEVSYHELGRLIGADNQTIEKYIDLLEKTFIVYRLTAFSRNIRNELKKGRKIYFYDNGIRNAIIRNFSPLSLRQDVGALWENFVITERMKANHYFNRYVNRWFWRTHSQQEIDYIEEFDGKIYAYELKWNPHKRVHFPKSFVKNYPGCKTEIISQDNYVDFLSDQN